MEITTHYDAVPVEDFDLEGSSLEVFWSPEPWEELAWVRDGSWRAEVVAQDQEAVSRDIYVLEIYKWVCQLAQVCNLEIEMDFLFQDFILILTWLNCRQWSVGNLLTSICNTHSSFPHRCASSPVCRTLAQLASCSHRYAAVFDLNAMLTIDCVR